MSNKTYDKIWHAAIQDLKLQVLSEQESQQPQNNTPTPFNSKNDKKHNATLRSIRTCGTLYIHYIRIYTRLEKCHNAMIQPQKRIDVKTTLELVICRIIEIRNQFEGLVRDVRGLNLNSNLNPGSKEGPNKEGAGPCLSLMSLLEEMNIPPCSFRVPIPQFFKEDNEKRHRRRDALVKGYMKMKLDKDELFIEEESDETEDHQDNNPNSTNAKILHPISSKTSKPMNACSRKPKRDMDLYSLTPTTAAIIIQKHIRTPLAQKILHHTKHEQHLFLGMKSIVTEEQISLQSSMDMTEKIRKQNQLKHLEEYERALTNLKLVVKEEEGYEITERLREERIRWITNHIANKNCQPDDLGGFYKKEEEEKKEGEAKKNEEEGSKSKESKSKELKTKVTIPNKNDEFMEDKPEITEQLNHQVHEYETIWQPQTLTTNTNNNQQHDVEMAKNRIIRSQVEEELAKQVDTMLVLNLTKIKALNGRGEKGKKRNKNKTKKKEKKKKAKKGKRGKKGKKEKPLPGTKISDLKNMDNDYMLSILVEHGIINTVRNVTLDNFVGTADVSAPILPPQESPQPPHQANTNNPTGFPTTAELKTLITEYCILPNGSSNIKKKINPNHTVRSVLLYGPSGSGKTLLVETVASELGALLINLSPEKLNDKFNETKSASTKLIHMAFTVAKDPANAPVVIYMDDCDLFFQPLKSKKKGPKVDKTGPVRFQKDLLIYKNQALTDDDQVIIIGTTSNPQIADFKLIQHKKGSSGKPEKRGFFERFIGLSRPHYSDRCSLWKALIRERVREVMEGSDTAIKRSEKNLVSNLDFHSLAYFTEGRSVRHIKSCVRRTLSLDRVLRLQVSSPSTPFFLREVDFMKVMQADGTLGSNHEKDISRFSDFAQRLAESDCCVKKVSGESSSKKKGVGKGGGKGKSGRKI